MGVCRGGTSSEGGIGTRFQCFGGDGERAITIHEGLLGVKCLITAHPHDGHHMAFASPLPRLCLALTIAEGASLTHK